MNIFYLSENSLDCAQWAVDKHCIKMILEAAQLLSTAHRVLDGSELTVQVKNKTGKFRKKKVWILTEPRNSRLYNATHVNHPCAKWARESAENYLWLWRYLYFHCKEYTHRYGKVHKVERDGLLAELVFIPKNIKDRPFSTPPSAMDAKYIISNDPIVNYRNYYKHGKAHLHSWKNREVPEWIKEN